MWPRNELTKMLGIDLPVVQAPMILQRSLVPLAAAVSNAGGMGSLGCAEMSLLELEAAIQGMRQLTAKPFNLNFFLHQPPVYRPELDAEIKALIAPFYDKLGLGFPTDTASTDLETFDEDRLSLLVQERPRMVSFHFGCPRPEVVEALKAAEIVTAATATTVREALSLQEAGIEVIVAQGWEAGGHRGSFESGFEDTGVGTLALVPQVVDAVEVPVIAAGGIGDGRTIAAAHALGADGVWMGTAFLSCKETPITPVHRAALAKAKDEDTHLSRAFSGRPCRARRTPYSEQMALARPRFQDFPLMYNYSGPLKHAGIASDDLEYQFLLYGQSAALNQDMTVVDFLNHLVTDASAVMKRLAI